MADFIDLMGFARGQQQANRENWQDTIYDINTRAAEENLRQSQTRFDMQLPSAQFAQEENYKAGLGARAGQEFQTNVLAEAGKLPPEQREQFIADSAIRRLQNLDPTSPGAAQERNSIENFLKVQAAGLTRTNPQAAATLYGAMTMGQSTADALRQVAMLSDPKTAYDPINIAALAGQLGGQYDQESGNVRFAGSNAVMPVDQFIGFARQRALDQTADLTPGMQRASNQAQLSAFADKQIEELRKNGILAFKNPVTNQVIPMFNIETGQQIPQTPAATGGPQMSMAPGVTPINPLAGTQPLSAQPPGAPMPAVAQTVPTGAYPETASMRYPAPQQVTPLWQEWLNRANQQQALVRAQREAVAAQYIPQIPATPMAPGYTPGVAPVFNSWITQQRPR